MKISKNNKILFVLTFLLLLSLIILVPTFSADVGNSFSGGISSSGGSSSSSGDGIFILVYLILSLPFPINFIALFSIGAAMYYAALVKKKSSAKKNVKRNDDYLNHVKKVKQSIINTNLIDLRNDDPNFSKYEFISYAKEVIIAIQEAVEDKDLSSTTMFISDKFQESLKELIDSNKYKIDGQEIMDAKIMKISEDENFWTITIELFISEIVNNSKRVNHPYSLEFMRKKGVKTPKDKLTTHNCPSCGAPSEQNNNGKCEYCQQTIKDGSFSWVLNKLELIKEKSSYYYNTFSSGNLFIHRNEQKIVSQILETDPTFNQEEFESYVGTAFIEVQEAWERRDMSTIRKFESEELFQTHSEQIKEYIEKSLYPHIDNQVINDVHLNNYEIDGKNEYITAIIDCDLVNYTTDKYNKKISGNLEIKTSGYRLMFKRKAGIKTDKTPSINNCANCGSEIVFDDNNKCSYCHTEISDGEYGWVLNSYEGIYRFKKNSYLKNSSIAEKIILTRTQ